MIVDNPFVNYELVAQGYAHAVPSTINTARASTFEDAQQKAFVAKAGLWNVPPTVPVLSCGGGGSGGFDHNGDGKVTCADFQTQAAAQQAYYAEYSNLDGKDKDGKACESLP